jgi:hypothetical protein
MLLGAKMEGRLKGHIRITWGEPFSWGSLAIMITCRINGDCAILDRSNVPGKL